MYTSPEAKAEEEYLASL